MEKSAAAARDRYDLLLAGTRPEQIDHARAMLAEIDTQFREMKISAPTNCVLEVLSVKAGDVLAPNHEVATLIMPQHLWVRGLCAGILAGENRQLGDAVKARVDSFPGQDFAGTVEQINRSAEFTPRNVQTVEERVKQVFGVKVRPCKTSRANYGPGMSADLVFPNVGK